MAIAFNRSQYRPLDMPVAGGFDADTLSIKGNLHGDDRAPDQS